MAERQNRSNFFRRGCNGEAIFLDAWYPGIDEHKVPEEALLSGEIEAATFQIGCYTVRSAWRVYTIQEPDWYLTEVGEPAGKEDVQMVKKDFVLNGVDRAATGIKDSIFASWGNQSIFTGYSPSWRDKLRITHELSAKHNSNCDKPFTYICRAADPINGKWFEYIGDIYAVKERDTVPDESASLLIYLVVISDFYGVDTWYRFASDGGIATFVSNQINLDGR